MLPVYKIRLPTAAEKRDDDFRPARSRRSTSLSHIPLDPPWRWRRRRLLGLVAALALLYLFLAHHHRSPDPPQSQTTPASQTTDTRTFRLPWRPPVVPEEPRSLGSPPLPIKGGPGDEKRRQSYDGPTTFPNLTRTLQKASFGGGGREGTVLFAAASLRSAANLIPMACEMVSWERNEVHFAIMGRDDVVLEEVLSINGVDGACSVSFHDARADWSAWSTDRRAEKAVGDGWKLLDQYLHPRVVIMDDAKVEEDFFAATLRGHTRDAFRTLIEIPAGRYEEFLWLTRLDAHALANWYSPQIEIFVHAPPRTSGGLLRLLKSLRDANYAGLRIPRLTIELRPDPEPSLYKYVSEMPWPPVWGGHPRDAKTLSIRHRIVNARMSPEQASVRFLESFYPSDSHNHALVLSAEVALSPRYLQYLHYTILENKYSAHSIWTLPDLIGISLELPRQTLDESGPFRQPLVSDIPDPEYANSTTTKQSRPTSFLYQAPSAKAALIFGDKWASLHEFLSHRFAVWEAKNSPQTDGLTQKLVPKTQPAWLEYVLELVRCRGWYFLYPSHPFATVSQNLAQIPEEFSENSDISRPHRKPQEPEAVPNNRHLHSLLPFRGALPPLASLPYIPYDGTAIQPQSSIPSTREEYLLKFRHQYGGCSAEEAIKRRRRVSAMSTSDLFCLPGQTIVEDEGVPEPQPLIPPVSKPGRKNAEAAQKEKEADFRQTLAALLAEAESEEVMEETDWSAYEMVDDA